MKRSATIIALIVTVAAGAYVWWNRRPVYAFPLGRIEAYQLEGDRIGYAGAAERLQNWPILQHRGIVDATQAKVRTAIADRRNYFVPGNRGYLCFNPRLAFRVGENEDAVDVLICLECRWVY